jgi:S-phase kinase-associated protein 1
MSNTKIDSNRVLSQKADEKGLDDGEGDISLVSKDEKQSFTLPKKYAFLSKLVKCTSEQDREATQIDLHSVQSNILSGIVSYLNHHKGVEPKEIKKPLRSLDIAKVVDDNWDATFINSFVQQELHDIIVAANYMDIPSLLHLGCARVASLIKGKTNEEIRTMFNEGKVGFVPDVSSVPVGAAGAAIVTNPFGAAAGAPSATIIR